MTDNALTDEALKLDTLIGHEAASAQLRRALDSSRVAQAYLFLGPDGVGKRRAAFAFAAELLAGGHDAAAVRRKIAAGNHPDLWVVEPDGRFIKKAAVDELIRRSQFAPFESERHVFIVLDAERMNPAAANALLKTLEEPTPSTVIVLVTSAPQLLLQTILSRCQKILFGPIATDLIARTLIAAKGWSEEDAAWTARRCDGSLGRALTMDPGAEREARERVGRAFFALPGKGDRALLDFAQELADWSEGASEGLEVVKTLIADAVRVKAAVDARRLSDPDLAAEAERFGARYTTRSLASKIRTVVYTQQLLARNANTALAIEAMLVDCLDNAVTNYAERIPLT